MAKKKGWKIRRIKVWDQDRKKSQKFTQGEFEILEKALKKGKVDREMGYSLDTALRARLKSKKIGVDFDIDYRKRKGTSARPKKRVPRGENQVRAIMILLEEKKEINEESIKWLSIQDFKRRGWNPSRPGFPELRKRLIKKLSTPEMDVIIKEAEKRLKEKK